MHEKTHVDAMVDRTHDFDWETFYCVGTQATAGIPWVVYQYVYNLEPFGHSNFDEEAIFTTLEQREMLPHKWVFFLFL